MRQAAATAHPVRKLARRCLPEAMFAGKAASGGQTRRFVPCTYMMQSCHPLQGGSQSARPTSWQYWVCVIKQAAYLGAKPVATMSTFLRKTQPERQWLPGRSQADRQRASVDSRESYQGQSSLQLCILHRLVIALAADWLLPSASASVPPCRATAPQCH